ncbi:MAG: cobalamin biosynthesis protein CobW [Burkholderia sp.]|nr:cobalamin biosynthesis protein CobW [Burkholderia sp.]
MRKLPVTIVTGFLGSGKTTLLRHILRNSNDRRIAVIINEFGKLGIDGEILKGCEIGCDDINHQSNSEKIQDRLYELANGCLCCTVQEEFYPVMEALVERRNDIDHVLIETSGLALPKPLVQAFQWPTIRNSFTVDAVVTIVDGPAVANGQFADNPKEIDLQRRADKSLDHESSLYKLFTDQLSAADLVIVNKFDLLNDTQFSRVKALIHNEVPPQVKVVGVTHGQLNIEIILGIQAESEKKIYLRHDYHGSSDDDHDHNHDLFNSIILNGDAGSRDATIAALRKLVDMYVIYRIKGFAALRDVPMRLVIQGVGQRFESYFDRYWRSDEVRISQFVLIGRDLDIILLKQAFDNACCIQQSVV